MKVLTRVAFEEKIGKLHVLLGRVGRGAVAIEDAVEDADGPLLGLPPGELGPLILVDLFHLLAKSGETFLKANCLFCWQVGYRVVQAYLGHWTCQNQVAHLDPRGQVVFV